MGRANSSRREEGRVVGTQCRSTSASREAEPGHGPLTNPNPNHSTEQTAGRLRAELQGHHQNGSDTQGIRSLSTSWILVARGSGRAVLMVTGRAALAAWAQKVVVMEGGEVRQQGPPHEVLRPGSLLRDWGQQGAPGEGDRGSGGEG